MTTNKKENFLIKSGRSIETINFCNKINVNQKDIVWLVNRIEKEYRKSCKIFRFKFCWS